MMNYQEALTQMSNGQKVQRSGWKEDGVFIFIIAGGEWDFETDVGGVEYLNTLPFICMKTDCNSLATWIASNADQLADDWQVVKYANSKGDK